MGFYDRVCERSAQCNGRDPAMIYSGSQLEPETTVEPKAEESPHNQTVATEPSEACMTPNCKNLAKTRGVCVSCITTMSRMIRTGGTTWNELLSLGLIAPKKPAGIPRGSGKVALALEAARAKRK